MNELLAERLDNALQPLASHGAVRHARRQGLIWAFDVDPQAIPAISADDAADGMAGGSFAQRYHLAARRHGLLLRPIGHTLYMMPPYILNHSEVTHLAQGALASLNDVLKPA